MEAVPSVPVEVDEDDREIETPAIRALGSLFKLTEVFLCDDAQMDTLELSSSLVRHGSSEGPSCSQPRDPSPMNVDSETHDYIPSTDDAELAIQMSALGLPVSFSTNKMASKKTGMTKRKAKGKPNVEDRSVCKANEDVQFQVSNASEMAVVSSVISCDNTSNYLCDTPTVSKSEMSYCDVAVSSREQFCSSGDGGLTMLTSSSVSEVVQRETDQDTPGELSSSGMEYETLPGSIMSNCGTEVVVTPDNLDAKASLEDTLQDASCGINNEELNKGPVECEKLEGSFMAYYDKEGGKLHVDIITDKKWALDSVLSPQASNRIDHIDTDNCKSHGDPTEWMTCWDTFYMRNYFYNIKTRESTWYPPLGMEHLAFSDMTSLSGEVVADATEREGSSSLSSNGTQAFDPCSLQDKTVCFEETMDKDKLSGNLHHEISSEIDLGKCGFVHGMDSSTSCSCGKIDELDDEKVSFCSTSCSLDHIDSLGNQQNQLCSEEVSRSESLSESVTVTSTEDADKLSDSMTSHSFDDNGLITSVTRNVSQGQSSLMISTTEEMDSFPEPVATKKKKRVRKSQSQRNVLSDDYQELRFHGMSVEQPNDILKYWYQRYFLFSRFDEGIKMDKEGWFSVTPETIAQHHASRCGNGVIIDCFTGVGGNAIQFAKRSNHVIAIDIDPQKIEYAQCNAAIYGVNDRIDFIQGDYFHLAPILKADIVFLSPPWGGPDYAKVQTFDINTMLELCDGYLLFSTARKIASKIVMFLPRNVDLNQLAELSLSVNPPWALEVEKNFLNGKLKAVTAYFSETSDRV